MSVLITGVSGALAGIVMLQIFNVMFALSLTPLKMWEISPAITLYCIGPVLITFFIAHKGIAFMRQHADTPFPLPAQ